MGLSTFSGGARIHRDKSSIETMAISGTDKLEVPTIYKAYFLGLCKGIYCLISHSNNTALESYIDQKPKRYNNLVQTNTVVKQKT